jgi:hypothetical protein
MKKTASFLAGVGLLGLLGALFVAGTAGGQDLAGEDQDANPQQIQKPTYDYMSQYLSRSTRPLGLNLDPLAREILGQKAAKWAIRAGVRHVLD